MWISRDLENIVPAGYSLPRGEVHGFLRVARMMVSMKGGDRWGSNPRSGNQRPPSNSRLRRPNKYKRKAPSTFSPKEVKPCIAYAWCLKIKGERGTDHDQITELYLCAQTAEGPPSLVMGFPTSPSGYRLRHRPLSKQCRASSIAAAPVLPQVRGGP